MQTYIYTFYYWKSLKQAKKIFDKKIYAIAMRDYTQDKCSQSECISIFIQAMN